MSKKGNVPSKWPNGKCGGLNENGSHRLVWLNVWTQFGGPFGKYKKV